MIERTTKPSRIKKIHTDKFMLKFGNRYERGFTVVKYKTAFSPSEKHGGIISLPQNICLPTSIIGRRVRVYIEVMGKNEL